MSTLTRFEDEVSEEEFGQRALLRRIGYLAKQRREEIGLGRIAFAQEAGLGSDKTVQNFETANRMPTPITQSRIERALGWKLGVIDEVSRQVNRKASTISMEELDAEDRLHIDQVSGVRPLSLVSNDDLIDELRRRLVNSPAPLQNHDAQNLFGLAASENREHLEDEGPDAE